MNILKDIIRNNNLAHLNKALNDIHFSNGINELNDAINRLKFDEHFFLQLFMAMRKQKVQTTGTKPLPDIGPYFKTISDFTAIFSIPFSLSSICDSAELKRMFY